MNLCVRLKVLWTEDEIKIKSVSIGGEDISSMQNFPSLVRGEGKTRTMKILFISRIINSCCEKCSVRITRGNESRIRYTRFNTYSLKFAYRLNNS